MRSRGGSIVRIDRSITFNCSTHTSSVSDRLTNGSNHLKIQKPSIRDHKTMRRPSPKRHLDRPIRPSDLVAVVEGAGTTDVTAHVGWHSCFVKRAKSAAS